MAQPPPSPAREILRLAVPAFLALVAEPLFLLADSAIVGHLGTPQLAGLGVASAALLTAANVFVFLAYGTTSIVARHVGAGDERGAVANGLDGVWLAAALGLVTSVLVATFARPLVAAFGASPDALVHAEHYLRASAAGIPAMLIVLAATGILRGVQDTTTPLVVSVAGFTCNVVLNVLLVGPSAEVGLALLSAPTQLWARILLFTGGLVLLAVASGLYIGARLGPGPRDGLMTGVHARFGLPVWLVRTAIEGTVLLLGWLLGGSVGLGTVAFALLIGPLVNIALPLFRVP